MKGQPTRSETFLPQFTVNARSDVVKRYTELIPFFNPLDRQGSSKAGIYCVYLDPRRHITMDLDDDAPPELIDTAAAPKNEIVEVTAKVPITIVTGKFPIV